MHILIGTPLFPPDIAAPAPYTKELVRRLVKKGHEVTVVTYGHLPENVSGATIIPVNKRQPLLSRMRAFQKAIIQNCAECDVIFVENGPSSELPAWFASLSIKTPLLVHLGDKRAWEKTKKNTLQRIISILIKMRAKIVITDRPKEKPEMHPFKPEPIREFSEYEHSWNEHLTRLEEIFTTYAKK